MSKTMDYASPNLPGRRTSWTRVGGALGVASNCIGLAIFLAACAGLNAVMVMSVIPLLLSVPGLILTILGATIQKDAARVEDTHVLASIFINIAGIVGGLVLVAAWRNWSVFPSGFTPT